MSAKEQYQSRGAGKEQIWKKIFNTHGLNILSISTSQLEINITLVKH